MTKITCVSCLKRLIHQWISYRVDWTVFFRKWKMESGFYLLSSPSSKFLPLSPEDLHKILRTLPNLDTFYEIWLVNARERSFFDYLTLSRRMPVSYSNQSIDLRSKSMDWFLYDNGLRLEKVKFLWKHCSFVHRNEITITKFETPASFISNFILSHN